MADQLSISPEAMMAAAQFLADQAGQLQAELDTVVRDWGDFSSTWTGKAASQFRLPWEEWHDGAKKATAILHERSQLLTRVVALMVEHESTAAQVLSSLPQQEPML